jgi:phage protein D
MAQGMGLGDVFLPHNMPAIDVVINGKNRTASLCERFISLSLQDNCGFEADSLSLVLDDSDGAMVLPRRDETIELAIGWVRTGLVAKGSFVIDDVEHSGAPDTISITARSAEFCGAFTEKRERAFDKTTLGKIVAQVATEHGWKLVMDATLAAEPIKHIDQQGESNANLLSRLAKEHDAVATVKAGHLLFFPAGLAKTASGKDIPPMALTRAMTSGHRFNKTRAEQYTGVVANWHDQATGKRASTKVQRTAKQRTNPKPRVTSAPVQDDKNEGGASEVIVGSKENVFTLPTTYATHASAIRAAISKWQTLQRRGAQLSFTLPFGVPDLIPLQPIRASGFKADIDAVAWGVRQVSHEISAGGFSTSVECECVEVEKNQCSVTDAVG